MRTEVFIFVFHSVSRFSFSFFSSFFSLLFREGRVFVFFLFVSSLQPHPASNFSFPFARP